MSLITAPVEKARRIAAPVVALTFSILLALSTARVTFGPLFYIDDEKGVPRPQIIGNSGAVTGAVICFLVFPSALWLLSRLAEDKEETA